MALNKIPKLRPKSEKFYRSSPSNCHSIGSAPATFGELIQGREPITNDDFLVTFPITLNSVAKFYGFKSSENLYVFPVRKRKSLKAAQLFLDRFNIKTGGILEISSDVREGKGLASSSADLVATLRALANYFNVEMQAHDLFAIMRQIEPTDGVMFDDAVSFFHRKVELKDVIGRLPRICILAVDEGGAVDTISYNKKNFDFSSEEKENYANLLLGVTKAIREKDVKQIGYLATMSTRLHQKRNHKKTLDKLEGLLEQVAAEGVINCHSGTFIGLCFDATSPESLDKILCAERFLEKELQKPIYKFFSR